MKKILLLIFLLLALFSSGQFNRTIDSLNLSISNSSTDLEKANIFLELGNEYFLNNNLNLSEKAFFKAKELAILSDNLELEIAVMQDYVNRFIHYTSATKAIELTLELQEKAKIQKNDTLLFNVYALLIHQYTTLGIKLEERKKIADFMVEIANHLNDNEKLFLSHFDMGVSTTSTTSIQHYNIALKYTNPEKDKRRITAIYNNLSAKYLELGDLDSAISCAEKAFKISKEINRIEGMAAASLRVANACYFKNDFNTAIAKGKQGLQLFKQAEILRRQDACAKVIGESYKELGNYKEALYYFEMMNVLKDSLESITQLNDAEFVDKKFAYELIQKEDSISLSKERTVSKLKLENINNALSKEKFKRYILYGGLGMILIFAIFLIITIQRKKRDNTIIKEQKQIVDEKNKEITDSIKYAKRIQNAILPHDKLVKEYLPNSFILYKPKDIVAGDFYWIEHKNNTTLFAAADCTGHGVPGAMVSVICNNALNRSVKEYGLTTPGEILDKTRQIVIQEFEKSDEDVKDGMDIALCSIKEQTLLYSGANNPLWVIKNNKLTEIFANKQPIGKFDKLEPFTTHSIKLEKNDTIYIFSDGFSDQFGGKKGKKFKSSKLKDLLISIQNKTMLEQRDILNYTFENWKGRIEQVDDVCIIGIRY